ncbi:MAG: hypothetical protein KJ749_02690 [Planctomycetes bacterium]|nr:hypothetical protein [Planctomycetota bacterium]
MRTRLLYLVICVSSLSPALVGQEPKIILSRPFSDPGGCFSTNVPSGWQEICETEVGRKTFLFVPQADSEDAGKMSMSIALIMGWRQQHATEEDLRAATARELQRFRDEAARIETVVAVRETKTVVLSRQSGSVLTIDEAAKDGKHGVVRMFVIPSMIHTFVIQYRLPKEDDELVSVQFERMIKRLNFLYPRLEEIDLEKLGEFSNDEMHVTVKHPPSWKATVSGEGGEREIVITSPKSHGPAGMPCPAVMVQKIANASSRFEGVTLTPEDILMKYRDLYLQKLEKACGMVVLHPQSARARLGTEAAIAYQLEFLVDDQSRYALLVLGIQKGTLVQTFLVAPAEQFCHYAALFGRILVTIQAF